MNCIFEGGIFCFFCDHFEWLECYVEKCIYDKGLCIDCKECADHDLTHQEDVKGF